MPARDVMSTDIVAVAANASLLRLPERVRPDQVRHGQRRERAVRPAAHLESGDALGGPYAQVLADPVSGVMSAPAIAVKESTPLQAVADLMLKHRARSIPVIHGAALVGVVARVDLVKALLSRPRDAVKVMAARVELPEVDDEDLRRLVTQSVRRLGLPLGGGFDVVARHGVG